MDNNNKTSHFIKKYALVFLFVIPVLTQNNENFKGRLSQTGIFLNDLSANWKPPDRELDLYSINLREFSLGFSDISVKQTQLNNQIFIKTSFSGPNLTLKDLILESNIHSLDWVTQEKIKRLKKRESIPKKGIEILANAIDLYTIDNTTTPNSINDLIIEQYINTDLSPLDDQSWSYSLDLPENISAKPTKIHPLSDIGSVIYDWKTRSFKIDPVQDSLYQIPMILWDYKFKIEDLSHVFSSAVELDISPKGNQFDLALKRGQFKLSNVTFTATPGTQLKNQSLIHLPELILEADQVNLNGQYEGQTTFHNGHGKFRIRNFEIKVPNALKEEPEIHSLFETLGIWNNALKIRVIELEVSLINQFTGEIKFLLQTPFLKISARGDLTLRQNIPESQIIMHNTEVRIHPIALGVRKWIREWEKNNGKTFNRQGATIVIELEGSIKDPIIIGF
tara:strand:- start:3743 stop:5092 length:1350 start_codon:yes stop_codon:yes gene_type:complete